MSGRNQNETPKNDEGGEQGAAGGSAGAAGGSQGAKGGSAGRGPRDARGTSAG
jgi:hypothetical protein